MTIDADVFRAILAMDAYNRGEEKGITVSGNSLGTATLSTSSTDIFTAEELASGFSAQTYTWNGKTVIAYRGTNGAFFSKTWWTDFFNGWAGGLGSSETTQTRLAVEFYKRFMNSQGGVELVGHSLGGGLAGFVGSLHGILYFAHRKSAGK